MLVKAHTRKMNQMEKRMSEYVARIGGFKKMSVAQETHHNKMAAEWDKMKSDREMAKQVDAGAMAIDDFNNKKLSNYCG